MKQPSHEKDKNEDNGVEGALISWLKFVWGPCEHVCAR